MSTVNTLIAIADLSFLALDIYDRVKDDPEMKANFDLLYGYYEQVKNGASDEDLQHIKAEVDRITQEVIAARRAAVDGYVNE